MAIIDKSDSWLDYLLRWLTYGICAWAAILLVQIFFGPTMAGLPLREWWNRLAGQPEVRIPLVKRLFKPGGFFLAVPEGPIFYKSDTQTMPAGNFSVDTYTVSDISGTVHITASITDYYATQGEAQRQIIFNTIAADYMAKLGATGRVLTRKPIAVTDSLSGDEIAILHEIAGHRSYNVIWNLIDNTRLFSLHTIAPDRSLCERILKSFATTGM
ncbi:hypothetical protein DSUL_40127 [Desulfovibrionales bacterium]